MGTYSYANSVQHATVGTSGTYDIIAYGGTGGGNSTYGTGGGAEEGGDFALTANEQLKIVTGGQGSNANYNGGGGGTFVFGSTDNGATYTLLVAAGGGGGAYENGAGKGDSTYTTASGNGYGGRGGAGSYFAGGGGGAGVKGSGTIGTSASTAGGGGGENGPSYAGGRGYAFGGNGGFGGGGGGGFGGGGGGGFTGGAGGYFSAGGGGTSYLGPVADTLHERMQDGENPNAGFVKITPNVVCYASGTLIRTARGDVAVEALQVGDLAVTASGARRPIKWLGHRDTDCARHPEPRKVWPVRVAAGALGGGLPYADLWLSPGHALCLDDVLYPVRALVHGDLIQQVEQDHVTYWHVELDSHDILVANGVQAESYLDTGNRSAFDNAPGVVDLHPDFEPRFTERFCRPYAESGPLVAAARYRLFGAAQTPATPTVHLVADGLVLTPARCGNTLTFVVPERTRQLRLASPSRRANGADVRTLGVLIGSIVIETSAGRHDITLDDPRLFAGFHDVERTSAGSWRWTDGAGHFANDLWADADGAFVMRLTGMFDRAEDERSERIAA